MKQIEEMQTVINRAFFSDFKNGHYVCIKTLSEHLYNAGYRKQSDVAREIFEEIEKEVAPKIPMKIQPIFKDDRDFEGGFINGKTDALLDILVLIAELKNKYTEG